MTFSKTIVSQEYDLVLKIVTRQSIALHLTSPIPQLLTVIVNFRK